jgi:hypothetical protein
MFAMVIMLMGGPLGRVARLADAHGRRWVTLLLSYHRVSTD